MAPILLFISLLSLAWLLYCHLKAQQALQWWSQRQSLLLLNEADIVRDSLLQDSFSLRRSLERSPEACQQGVEKLEVFHRSLEQLSDRLSPPHVEYSLPLAIEWLTQSWQPRYPQLNIKTQLPSIWQDTPPEGNLIILRVLDELLQITANFSAESLQICLKQREIEELNFKISFAHKSMLIAYSDLKELNYLRQTFRFLTSGQCVWQRQGLTGSWCFRWRSPKHQDAT